MPYEATIRIQGDSLTSEAIKRFMDRYGLEKIVAFSGGADEAEEKVRSVIDGSIKTLKDCPFAILSGGSSFGVPKYASEIAKSYGMKTIGVMPDRGEKYAVESLDMRIVIPSHYGPSEWGDESEVYAKMLDAVEMIAGSSGTGIEFYHIMKMNSRIQSDRKKALKELEERKARGEDIEDAKNMPMEDFKYVVPIVGLGRFSESIPALPIATEIPEVFPADKISEGRAAAEYTMMRLGYQKDGARMNVKQTKEVGQGEKDV